MMIGQRIALTFLLAMTVAAVTPVSAPAKRLYPVSGGTRTATDPKEKKQKQIVAESDRLRLTIAGPQKYDLKGQVAELSMRIENLSDEPIEFDPTKFSAVDEVGRGYMGLAADDAIDRHFAAIAAWTYALSSALTGRNDNGHMDDAVERKIKGDILQVSIRSGLIPPHSFKEGLVYFEAPKDKKATLKVNLAGLWPEAILVSTER